MKTLHVLLVLSWAAGLLPAGLGALPDLNPHPRLMAGLAEFERLRAGIGTDPVLTAWYARLRAEGDALQKHPVFPYELRDGVRLLMVSRDILRTVSTEALLYRIGGERRDLDRAWAELDNAARFADWHPAHFLDVAEMAAAVALGYDWLAADLDDGQKAELRAALIAKALRPGAEILRQRSGWARTTNNWNFVCNGGLMLAALAIADEDRTWLDTLLPLILASLPAALAGYAPDGAWNESPGYWDYGTTYLVELITSLERSFGSDYGLWSTPGLDRTGLFAVALSGPGRYNFSFGDVGGPAGWVSSPALWALGRHYGQGVDGWARRQAVGQRPLPLDLLWYDPAQASVTPEQAGLPLGQLFRRADVATFRSSWSDPKALFVGIKGTQFPDRNHSDLDSGTVVVGALGGLWFTDLGSDDYNLPGYFTMDPRKADNRWNLYRKRAEGHNTLVVNPGRGPDQDPAAFAPLVLRQEPSGAVGAEVDLTKVVPGALEVTRTVMLAPDRTSLSIHDRVRLASPGEVWAFFHLEKGVEARVSDEGRTATLSRPAQPGSVVVTWEGDPQTAGFTLADDRPLPTSPQPRQNPNTGYRKLSLHWSQLRQGEWTITVVPRP